MKETIVTLTKDLNILNLFLKSIPEEYHEQVIVGYDDNIRKIYGDYKCKFINIDDFCDDFFFRFTTFKKCILIKHLLEQGYRNFLFCDDDAIMIQPVDFAHTRVKPINHVDFSCSNTAKIFGFFEHRYEAAAFVLKLSEEDVSIYMDMFNDFVSKLKEYRHLFLAENKEEDTEEDTEKRFHNFFSDTMFLNMFFDKITKVVDEKLVVNYCDLKLQMFTSYFENYLKNNTLTCNILHFSGAPKRSFMELYYKVKNS